MRILALSFFPGFAPPTNGGQVRLLHFYRALAEHHRVVLLSSSFPDCAEEIVEHGPGFTERRIPKDVFFAEAWAQLAPLSAGGDLSGPCIAASGRRPTALHRAYIEEYERADVIVHDSPFTVDVDLFALCDRKLRIYNAYNCESRLYRQLHEGPKVQPIHDLVLDAERRLLEVIDLLLYCSAQDLEAFRAMCPSASFEAAYVPNGTTVVPPLRRADDALPVRFSALFMGSGHPPNVRAAQFIIDRLAPDLPQIDFHLVGSCQPQGRLAPNVYCHGVVSDTDKRMLMAATNIALNPMDGGGGSNVKVLDYFAHGLPVLSTPFGMRGLDVQAGRDYLTADLDTFARVLDKASTARTSLESLATAGRELALRRYTWQAIAADAAASMQALLAQRANDEPARIVLVLNDYDPFASVGGGATRTAGLYEAVLPWSPVVVLCFSIDGTLAARRTAAGTVVVSVPRSAAHEAESRAINARFHVSADDIVASRHSLRNGVLTAIYRNLRDAARCIVCEHCYLAPLPHAWNDRFVYSSQNHEAALKREAHYWHPLRDELLRDVERVEAMAVEEAALTVAVSEEDAAALVRGKRSAGAVLVVRNGASSDTAAIVTPSEVAQVEARVASNAVVFLGSAHTPNAEAAAFIVKTLAPSCPTVQFHLVGSVCTGFDRVPPNVMRWGVLDEATKNAVLRACTIAINPVTSGSGSNVKLADYLRNGLFVVTTAFGLRGYPQAVWPHAALTERETFAQALRAALKSAQQHTTEARRARAALFAETLTMRASARRFLDALRSLEMPRRRVLVVTYRYTAPAMGGAEVLLERFVRALGESGRFDVDVVAPEVSTMTNWQRFNEQYAFDPSSGALVDVPHIRFARFAVDRPDAQENNKILREIWRTQPQFERVLSQTLQPQFSEAGLTWGWGYPETSGNWPARWCFVAAGLFLVKASTLTLIGSVDTAACVTLRGADNCEFGPTSVEGPFELTFEVPAGEAELLVSAPTRAQDTRPLGLRVQRLKICGQEVDLGAATLVQRALATMDSAAAFDALDRASAATRSPAELRLTDCRGPWSAELERFIAENVAAYDLVVTHNSIFRPPVFALAEAQRHSVPSILIPHAHLDDDFYHFPDVLQSARDATLVLATPSVACDFLAHRGCRVRHLPAGCDTGEAFTAEDEQAFRHVCGIRERFVLVLGRKAAAKGYSQVISAVEELNRGGADLRVVLIGPDDDQTPIDSSCAIYLGRQPREVVRGALQSCLALCNMSSSESFGIVLLEAWLAGRPVIVNEACAAFREIAIDRGNALLVDPARLPAAITELAASPDLCDKLARSGRETAEHYDWQRICDRFVEACAELAGMNQADTIPQA